MEGIVDERRPPFEDDVVRYYGQYVALAVADTFETAKAAADAVRATYMKEKPNVNTDLKADNEPEECSDDIARPASACKASAAIPTRAFASAPVKLDQTYVTPTETHNPIELQGTTAIWDGQMLTIYEESQAVFNLRSVLAQMFGLAERKRPRHHEIRWLRFRQQALAMDALPARRRGGAAAW